MFFDKITKNNMRYNSKDRPKLRDPVLLIDGPDMGKTGVVLDIDNTWTIVKLDFNGNEYQEVKNVKLKEIAKLIPVSTVSDFPSFLPSLYLSLFLSQSLSFSPFLVIFFSFLIIFPLTIAHVFTG